MVPGQELRGRCFCRLQPAPVCCVGPGTLCSAEWVVSFLGAWTYLWISTCCLGFCWWVLVLPTQWVGLRVLYVIGKCLSLELCTLVLICHFIKNKSSSYLKSEDCFVTLGLEAELRQNHAVGWLVPVSQLEPVHFSSDMDKHMHEACTHVRDTCV